MYTNIKANPKYRTAVLKLVKDAFTSIQLAEKRETHNEIMKDFSTLVGVDPNSDEFEKVIDQFITMMEDAVSYEDHETLPDDFSDRYPFGKTALGLGLVIMDAIEEGSGEPAFTREEFKKQNLNVIEGGKSDA